MIVDRVSEEDLELSQEGKILVVGEERFFPELKKHPRVDVMEVSRYKTFPEIPKKTELILCTRRISHSHYSTMKKCCTSKGVFLYPRLLGDREVRELIRRMNLPVFSNKEEKGEEMVTKDPIHINFLQPSVRLTPTKTEVVLEEPVEGSSSGSAVAPKKRGFLKEFVLQHGNPDYKVIASEARRLFGIAKKEGINTTFHSIEKAVGRHLMGRYFERRRKTILLETKEELAEVEVAAPVAIYPIDKINESLDAIKKFVELSADIKNVAELCGVAVLEIQEKNKLLAEELEILRNENELYKETLQSQESRLAKLKELLG